MKYIPDLLNLVPHQPRDFEERKKLLSFAFATGDSAGALGDVLDRAEIWGSRFEPKCFADDLFIDDFIDECMDVRIGSSNSRINKTFLRAILCHGLHDPAAIRFRQEMLDELVRDENTRQDLEEAYRILVELRKDLDSSGEFGRVYFARWRMEVLGHIGHAVELLKDRFVGVCSGLARIREYAIQISETEGYRNLTTLLEFEDKMATVGMQLRLGADGRVRGFEIVNFDENGSNRFYVGPWRRLLSRLSALLRGYQVTGEELLSRWVERVFEQLVEHLVPFLQLIGDMEFYLAALHFRDLALARGLETCLARFEGHRGGRQTSKLFNPLLLSMDAGPIPCDISTGHQHSMVIVTGPNSAGKTRLLQSLAFEQMLGQAGCFVNAAQSELSLASGMFVSLLERESADQKEGRLGLELLRIRSLFENGKPGGLVVLDELCSGTNPSEGEEIFLLVASLLHKLGVETFVSTHFLRFASKLENERPFLHLEFLRADLDSGCEPTYQFVTGVAQTSLAGQTAKRLGVTREELLKLVEQSLSERRGLAANDPG